MSDANGDVVAGSNVSSDADAKVVETSSPPAAAMPARVESDPRQRLYELARELVRTRSRQLMFEYLRLRRSLR